MKIANIFIAVLFWVSFVFGAPAQGKENDDKDKVTLTINATCVADAALQDKDFSLKDKVAATLSERATYRIVSSEGERLRLELIDHGNSINIAGGGTVKDPTGSRSWTYTASDPATANAQGGVSIDTKMGTGKIYLNNFVKGGKIKASKEEVMQYASQVADMALTFGTATSPVPVEMAESNEQFIKGLSFTFDPKSKQITSSGQANYKFTLKGEKGPVGTGTLNVSYQVQSGVPEVLEAVLIPKGDYKKWLPKATAQGPDTPGNTITFAVELRNPKGGKAMEKTAQFEIELLDTSRYPGATMNSPWAGVDPDLKILRANNPKLAELASDGQTAKTVKGLTTANIIVSSFDGAAIGRLSVLAHIDGEDTMVVAHLENEPELIEVSIPYDSNGNTIADAWENENDVWGKPIESDEDTDPPGDRHNGDGLTVWEEYRGFLEEGKHIRTNPLKKDLFISDTIGGRSKRGINRFAALSELAVHDKLTPEELSFSRVINRNRSGDEPHVVDQHGLRLDSFTRKQEDYSGMSVGGPGTPKSIVRVIIDDKLPDTVTRNLDGSTAKTFEYFFPTVAHELFHCCNVWHHGQRDVSVFWKVGMFFGNKFIFEYRTLSDCDDPGKGVLLHVFHENGGEYPPSHAFWETPREIYIGLQQGQHSGDDGCVMRYDISQAYLNTNTANGYYCVLWEPQETVGQGLCVLPFGKGVNLKGRSPKSRYGEADKGRGACADKICVNDLYH